MKGEKRGAKRVCAAPIVPDPFQLYVEIAVRFECGVRDRGARSIRGSEIVPPTPLFHARTKFDRRRRRRRRVFQTGLGDRANSPRFLFFLSFFLSLSFAS